MNAKPIGELNGIWSLSFKVGQIVMPLLVALQVWVVSNIFAFKAFMIHQEETAFTVKNAKDLEMTFERQIQSLRIDLLNLKATQRNERQTQVTDMEKNLMGKLDNLITQTTQLRVDLVTHVDGAPYQFNPYNQPHDSPLTLWRAYLRSTT